MSDAESTRFYVYIHLKPNGEVFYVGKGCGKRAWSPLSRNNHWNSIVAKHGGFKVTIIRSGLTEQQSFNEEQRFIRYFASLGKLCNRTLGGYGQTGNPVNKGVPKTEIHKNKLKLANIGKKQTQKTIDKRKKTMAKKIEEGWIPVWKRDEYKKVGVKNVQFKGYYSTPMGVFETVAKAAAANNCKEKAIRVRCFGNKCVKNGKLYLYKPKDGWSFIPRNSDEIV